VRLRGGFVDIPLVEDDAGRVVDRLEHIEADVARLADDASWFARIESMKAWRCSGFRDGTRVTYIGLSKGSARLPNRTVGEINPLAPMIPKSNPKSDQRWHGSSDCTCPISDLAPRDLPGWLGSRSAGQVHGRLLE
jgi:hypothetical protein